MAERTMSLASVPMLRTATLLLIWAAWEALARSGLMYEGVVPSSVVVIASIVRHLGEAAFYGHTLRTAQEVLGGFAIGSLTGIAAGIGFGARRFIDRAAAPYIHGLASTPKIVFLPILMLMLGVGIGSKIGIAAFSSFFPVTIAVAAGMLSVDPVLVRVARGFNASPWQIVAKVYLPSLVRPAVTGMRLGLGVAIVGTLLAEIKFSNQGLGHLAIQHYNFFRVADMYAVLLLTFALAVVANSLMGWIGDRLVRHR
jgi:ABC-type nitrate/sulfonate/bicarbonate transport system permease component